MYGLRARRASRPDYNIWCPCGYATSRPPTQIAKGPIFDTNRAWTSQLPALMELFPNAKLICCVRDVSWIMDSLERRFRSSNFENTKLFNSPSERATVYTRVETLAHPNRLVGFAYHPSSTKSAEIRLN